MKEELQRGDLVVRKNGQGFPGGGLTARVELITCGLAKLGPGIWTTTMSLDKVKEHTYGN